MASGLFCKKRKWERYKIKNNIKVKETEAMKYPEKVEEIIQRLKEEEKKEKKG